MDMIRMASAKIMAFALGFLLVASLISAAPLLDDSEQVVGKDRDQLYDSMVDALFANGRVVTYIGDKLWVPWYKTSSSSAISDLHETGVGPTDYEHNLMVSDEFSQVGVLIAMGSDQRRMDAFYNTLGSIKGNNGLLPSWRILRDGDNIIPVKEGVNGNGDSASDADARIITALFTASENANFDSSARSRYADLARAMTQDFLNNEVVIERHSTAFGDVDYWLAGGAGAKKGGFGSSDFTYAGYFPDAIIAMLAAYSSTGDETYLKVAQDFTLNYLQAASFNGRDFTAPPGKTFKWNVNGMTAEGQQGWDEYDASRALAMGQAYYYAQKMNVDLPHLQEYLDAFTRRHMNGDSTPLILNRDGSGGSYSDGYFAQGLAALHSAGGNPNGFKNALDKALNQYTPETSTFNREPAMGVYAKTFAIRALGMGIGRDDAAFVGKAVPERARERSNGANMASAGRSEIVMVEAGSSEQPILSFEGQNTDRSDLNSLGVMLLNSNLEFAPMAASYDQDTCRVVKFTCSEGDFQMKGCNKDDGSFELYQQSKANCGDHFTAYMGQACITEQTGFAKLN